MTKYDRNTPYNDLPILPPTYELENDPEILKKLVLASRALASMDSNVLRLPNPYMLVNTTVQTSTIPVKVYHSEQG